MTTHYLDGRTYQVATSWNELTPAQLVRAVHVLFTPATEPALQTRLIAVLMQLYRWQTPSLTWRFIRMPLIDVADFRRYTAFLMNEQAKLTHQLLPVLRTSWCSRKWYGPGDYLANLTFAEWIAAETAVFDYRQRKDEKYLNRLVAILYRPGSRQPGPTGDRRGPYIEHELEASSTQAARLSIDVRRAVLVYFDSCRQFYIDYYPDVFSADDDTAPEAEPKAAKNPGLAYVRVLRELAGSVDRFEVMGQQQLSNVLFDMSERVKRAKQVEKEVEELRNKS